MNDPGNLSGAHQAVNFSAKDSSREALARDLEYILSNIDDYLRRAPENSVQGKNILEIGPGINLGIQLGLVCYGAKVTVVDRFLTSWDANYHRTLYAMLRAWFKKNRPEVDTEPIRRCLDESSHSPDVITCLATPAELLEGVADESVDISFSNAVFEHLYDLDQSFASLARVMKKGAAGFHQVDFRDHRGFDRPLEYLLLSAEEFREMFDEKLGECGNRWRPFEMKPVLEKHGFEVVSFKANMFSDDAYLDDLMPRLQEATASPYRNFTREQLREISGLFEIRKV